MKSKSLFITLCLTIITLHLPLFSLPDFPVVKGPYLGQKKPGLKPKVFAPGIISTREQYEMNSVFSLDGKEFFYVISTTTPEEKKQGRYYYVIMVTRQVKGTWTRPRRLKVAGNYSATDIALSIDGQRLYFCSDKPSPWNKPPSLDIWYIKRQADGWSEPINAGPAVNSLESETQPSFTRNGKMFFPSFKKESQGVDIFYARMVNGKFPTIVNLGPPVNSSFNEGNAFVAPDESYILFARWGMPKSIDGGKGLYISFRKSDNSWTKPENTKPKTGIYGSLAALSPDGKYLFYSSGGDIYWVDARVIQKLKPKNL